MGFKEIRIGDPSELLDIPAPWRVSKVEEDKEREHLRVHLRYARGSLFHCPECGVVDQPVRDTRPKRWEDLRLARHRVFIVAQVPRIKCGHCHALCIADVPWARRRSGLTRRLEELMVTMCIDTPVKKVADWFGIGDDRLWRFLKRYVDFARRRVDLSRVRNIGIDETSTHKRHKYITVVRDCDTGSVIFACPGRNKTTIREFVRHLIAHGGDPGLIVRACIDMSPAYIAGMREFLPGAEVVFDKFHVVKLANVALDKVRRAERKVCPEDLKHMRFVLLKNGEAIPEGQAALIAALSRKRLKTARAYDMKERLRGILKSGHLHKFAAEITLRIWISRAKRSGIDEFETLGATIEDHLGGILAIFGSGGMSNGPNEALNGLIQAAKARARGFRTLENLIAITFLVAGRLEHLPPSPWKTVAYEGPIYQAPAAGRYRFEG